MNKAYRLIWSQVKDAWVIVAEIVKGNGGPPPLTMAVMIAATMALLAAEADALPTGQQVVSGSAVFSTAGNTLTIKNSPNAIINWQGFSIAANETTRFNQDSALSSVLNRVTGLDPSQIFGSLQSNGKVFLINPNGIIFGQGSRIDVAGLVASSLGISNQDFLAGKYNFTAGSAAGAIKNQGEITTTAGGLVWLISPDVENSGIITAPNGTVMLAAGQSVNMVDPQRPEIAVVVSAPADQAVNIGTILTQGGSAGIFGSLVNQKGVVSATSAVAGDGGRIFLKGINGTTLAAGSVTEANGVNGGSVTVQSTTGDTLVSGSVRATGSTGTGGNVQILGDRVALTGATVDVSGDTGGGTVLVGGDYQGKNPDVQNAKATYISKDSIITADSLFKGDGGKIIVWSDDSTKVHGTLTARGGAEWGNGGFIETSGHFLDTRGIKVDASAKKGKAGTWLLDPYNVEIGYGASYTYNGNFDAAYTMFTPNGYNSYVNAGYLGTVLGSNNVTITTGALNTGGDAGNITVSAPVSWNNYQSTLELTAHGSVFVNAAITGDGPLVITGGSPASVTGAAGATNTNANPGVSINAPVTAASINITGYGGKGADCNTAGCAGGTGGHGVEINNTMNATAGDITIKGFGGDGGSAIVAGIAGGNAYGGNGGNGVFVSSGAQIYSSGYYNIRLEGTGGKGGAAVGGDNDANSVGQAWGGSGGHGIYNYGQIGANNIDANITLVGFGGDGGGATGGNSTGSYAGGRAFGGSGGHGVYMYYGSASAQLGGITLEGTGGKGGFGTGGSGTVNAFGGNGYAGDGGRGVFLYQANLYANGSGDITLNGTGKDGGIGTGGIGAMGSGMGYGGYGGRGVYLYNSTVSSPAGYWSSATNRITVTGHGGAGGAGNGGIDSYGGNGGRGIHLYHSGYTQIVQTNGDIVLNGYAGAGGGSAGGTGGDGGSGLRVEYGGAGPGKPAVYSYNGTIAITGHGGAGGIGSSGTGVHGFGVEDSWLGGEGAVSAATVTVDALGGINLTGITDSITLNNSGSGDISFSSADWASMLMNSGLTVSGANTAAGGGFNVTDTSGNGITVAGIMTSNGPVTIQGDSDVTFTGAINAGTGAATITAGSGGGSGAITGLTGASSINAGSAVLSAKSGIGTAATPLITAVNNITANNSISGDINIANTGVLTVNGITNNAGSITLDNAGGITVAADILAPYDGFSGPPYTGIPSNISILAHSPLTVNSGVNITAAGGVTLGAGASGSALDNLLINGNVTAQNSNILLQAGNLINVSGGTLSAPNGTVMMQQNMNPPIAPLTTQTAALLPGIVEATNYNIAIMGSEATDMSEDESETEETSEGENHGTEFRALPFCN